MIDEKGVTGAAYTLSLRGMGAPPDEIVDFILDRPFLFVVQGHDGLPLFVGIVNQP
jgi:serine protease inhibitor